MPGVRRQVTIGIIGMLFWSCSVSAMEPEPMVNGCKNFYRTMPQDMRNYLLTLVSLAATSGYAIYASGGSTVVAEKIDDSTIHLKYFRNGQTTIPSCIELCRE